MAIKVTFDDECVLHIGLGRPLLFFASLAMKDEVRVVIFSHTFRIVTHRTLSGVLEF